MLVLATNRPGDLDTAVTDRVDESLVFGLPSLEDRRRLIDVYFEKYISRAGEDVEQNLSLSRFLRPPTKIKVRGALCIEEIGT